MESRERSGSTITLSLILFRIFRGSLTLPKSQRNRTADFNGPTHQVSTPCLPPSDSSANASHITTATAAGDVPKLCFYLSEWYVWSKESGRYIRQDDDAIEAQLRLHLHTYADNIVRSAVGDIIACVKAQTIISASKGMPSWNFNEKVKNQAKVRLLQPTFWRRKTVSSQFRLW